MEIPIVMPRKLTAENGAKALLSGEFVETFEVFDEDIDEFVTQSVPVSWTTIKKIYDRIVEHRMELISEE